MEKNKFWEFGKKTDNKYRIIERKFKDNNVLFFVEITNTLQSMFEFIDSFILEESFKTYDEALECVNKLKEEDKKITVLEEIIHEIK
ncbi:hypothetical protein M0Q97_09970 [Candidatus Dojkabacteria bacterium]|jgi:hypothetical protein|nr:hypothetical protein [Candidatus Dojkabacteria bacterium]